jgi:FtsH-binding integral membrane protein
LRSWAKLVKRARSGCKAQLAAAPARSTRLHDTKMTQRTRKLLGIPLMLLIIICWSLGASMVYEVLIDGLPNWVIVIYFAIAGTFWFFPAAAAIWWMSRPDPE